MEALAAFGLACNVMQTIQFTFEVSAACKSLFRNGAADPCLEKLVERSEQLYQSLKDSLLHAQPVNRDEHELATIAGDCLDAAAELKREVGKLTRRTTKGKRLTSLARAVEIKVVRQGRVDKLKAKMANHQKVLETRLLVRVCDKATAINIQQEARFHDLGETLRDFIQAYAEGQTRIQELIHVKGDAIIDAVRSESSQTREMVASSRQDTALAQQDIAHFLEIMQAGPTMWQKRDKLLRSLRYDTMNDRFSQILQSHEGTYRWILDGIRPWLGDTEGTVAKRPDRSHLHPDCSHASSFPDVAWKCFPCWLKSPSDKIYWIQGKAGSGKSTLMKFLVTERQAWPLGSASNNRKGPLVLSHFLWAAGTYLQKSIRGILLALVQQFLSAQQQILDAVLDSLPMAFYKDSQSDWFREELERVVFTWFIKSDKPVFIFLDGLDEIGDFDNNMIDTPTNLLHLVNKLAAIDNVKLCVSSRLEPEFKRQLDSMPTLRLQDVTRLDMKVYAEANLLRPDLEPNMLGSYNDLIEALCDKADGVFLWLALATRSLARGITNGDKVTELKLRLEGLPAGLNSLYQEMWFRMNDDQRLYREEAARYFNMVRDWSEFAVGYSLIEVFHVMLASDPSKASAVLQDYTAFSPEEIEAECQTASRRIATRTAGLLEIGSDGRLVGFIHRSAVEFLESTPEGQKILAYDNTPPGERILNLMKAFLAGVCLQVSGHRQTKAYSAISEYFVMNSIHQLWTSAKISDHDGLGLMMACKKLYETGKWRVGSTGYDSAQVVHTALDFYGVSASFGLEKTISFLTDYTVLADPEATLTPLARRYLFVAASTDPNIGQTVEYIGKALVIEGILGGHRVCDLEDQGTKEPLLFLALLNIHAGNRHWPKNRPNLPGLPKALKQYLDSSFSLEEKITLTLRRRGTDDDHCWLPNVHCLGAIETMYARQACVWLTLETDLASLAELCLTATTAGPDAVNDPGYLAARLAIRTLKAMKPKRHVKLVAFGFTITNIPSRSLVGDRDGKALVPATAEDADHVLSCLDQIQLVPHEQVGNGQGEDREYRVPGLLKCLKKIAVRAPALEEDRLEKAKDLPLRKAILGLLSKLPESFTG
ncbi:hypothetical protein B0T25DRAFT_530909 [Lasiosphaeria hispida]|uniref:NACHT domain-containing protein n=1 Tax=Lasiosphaeria hispida TaxID=260671 RepID=A0AAJ0MGX4_9PEZI|nr:hypothetical protein B0T25DRAFT_530909 [Lasiosphaeria hispida]